MATRSLNKLRPSERAELPAAPNSCELIAAIKQTLAQSNPDIEHCSTDVLLKMLFENKQWRLSTTGYRCLARHYCSYRTAKTKDTVINGKILLNMDRCCRSPWYMDSEAVYVFDSALHFELEMMGGNINYFIDFKKVS